MAATQNIGIAPAGYHKHFYSDRNWQAYADLLARIVRHSQPGPILDLGAGCGYFVEAANRWGFACVGLEGSPEALEMAKERGVEIDLQLHRLSDNLPFAPDSFQTVVLNQVIEHLEVEIMRQTLHEAHRVLRPGGMILITSPSCFNKHELQTDPTHINLLSPKSLQLELTESGFEKCVPFDSPLDLLGENRLGRGILFVIFRLLRLDRLSATANLIAYKRQDV